MKRIHVDFADIAAQDGTILRKQTACAEPVIVVVHYAVVPYLRLLFYPPQNAIWRFLPAPEICPDEEIPGNDDEVERIVDAELAHARVKKPVFGVLSEADSFDKSSMKKSLGWWPCAFNVKPEQLDARCAYLRQWWDALGEESIARVDDEIVRQHTGIQAQYETFAQSDCGHFMMCLWELNPQRFARAKRFAEGKTIAQLVEETAAHITPVVEAEAAIPGHVQREMIIRTGMYNKRLVEIAPFDADAALKERDALFYTQCQVVRRLGKVSMFWRVQKAISRFDASLRLAPNTFSEDPMRELREYAQEMTSRFPVLKLTAEDFA
ncbi:MAG: hypothetical protein IK051_11190 [Rhodocyclaceae bacterium]|nr:hypothetical protein [Rhodocyclaceae bacterium]